MSCDICNKPLRVTCKKAEDKDIITIPWGTMTTDYGGTFCSPNCAMKYIKKREKALITLQRWLKKTTKVGIY